MKPNFPRLSNGILQLDNTAEAKEYIKKTHIYGQPSRRCLPPKDVHELALKSVRAGGGDIEDECEVLGHYKLQFGKYAGKTFKWVLENDLGYTAYLTRDIKLVNICTSDLGQHKIKFRRYAFEFSEVTEAIKLKEKARPKPKVPVRPPSRNKKPVPEKPSTEPKPVYSKSKPSVKTSEKTITSDDEELCSVVDSIERASQQSSRVPYTTPHGVLPLTAPKHELPLPEGWRQTLPEHDHAWVSKALFRMGHKGKAELDMSKVDKIWWHPPQPSTKSSQLPRPSRYFAQRLLLWLPRKLWKCKFLCTNPKCNGKELTGSGLYRRVRQVLDIDSFYNLATEYLECTSCKKKSISWSNGILNQLDVGHREQFPALLTYQYACDVNVISSLRRRTLGNSSTLLFNNLHERHSERFMRQKIIYLTDVKHFRDAFNKGIIKFPSEFVQPPDYKPVPTAEWLLTVYVQDILRRLDDMKGLITSTFGQILKMDSTKRVLKKLAGHSQGTATWVTNVGNEHGEVLMSVLTVQEGSGLAAMADGIMARYETHKVPSPKILYVDRGCCGNEYSVLRKLYNKWPDMKVRLDIWHCMRRFASAVTTESHQLYGEFMARLSECIFVLSDEDFDLLIAAKKGEMECQHIVNPSRDDVIRNITKRELALHCRRKTRGFQATVKYINNLLDVFMGPGGNDTIGVPLLDADKVKDIWESQKKHLRCIQDPDDDGIILYTQTGTLVKGNIQLPVYRCARGSTSLESFHLHLNRFIPGECANAMHFQAYLIEGLYRWNIDRYADSTNSNSRLKPRTYNNLLKEALYALECENPSVEPGPGPPKIGNYTGELIGVEYLFNQTGKVLEPLPDLNDEDGTDILSKENEDTQDEGFIEDQTLAPATVYGKTIVPAGTPLASCSRDFVAAHTERQEAQINFEASDDGNTDSLEYRGPNNVGGYDKVMALASYLVNLRDCVALNQNQAKEIRRLWHNLDLFDKKPIQFTRRYRVNIRGRFMAKKTQNEATAGIVASKRCAVGSHSTPAVCPSCSRYLEAAINMLCDLFPCSSKSHGDIMNRWSRVTQAYRDIQRLVLNDVGIMSESSIQLPDVNRTTLIAWYNRKSKKAEILNLKQGATTVPKCATERLNPAVPGRLPARPKSPDKTRSYDTPPNTEGTATIRSDVAASRDPSIPKTTFYRRRKKEREEAAGTAKKRKYTPKSNPITCKDCGKDRKSEGHTQFKGNRFCAATSTVPHEQWHAALKAKYSSSK